jgi:hypothetical protein
VVRDGVLRDGQVALDVFWMSSSVPAVGIEVFAPEKLRIPPVAALKVPQVGPEHEKDHR